MWSASYHVTEETSRFILSTRSVTAPPTGCGLRVSAWAAFATSVAARQSGDGVPGFPLGALRGFATSRIGRSRERGDDSEHWRHEYRRPVQIQRFHRIEIFGRDKDSSRIPSRYRRFKNRGAGFRPSAGTTRVRNPSRCPSPNSGSSSSESRASERGHCGIWGRRPARPGSSR
jgi:hypothetical protein